MKNWFATKHAAKTRREHAPELSEPASYETNDAGDIVGIVDADGQRHSFDPAQFGWLIRGGSKDVGNERRSLEAVSAIPGMAVTVTAEDDLRVTPRTRPKRSKPWKQWPVGQAPPAVLMSKGDTEASHRGSESTRAFFDRLTEAVGQVARNLPGAPDRSPMVIYDFVNGRRISIAYTPPAVSPGNRGTVYLLDDGTGFKIGWTSGTVAQRISGLQTGNPRMIIEMAAISDAGPDVESHLHGLLGPLHLSGEWYQRGHIVAEAAGLGGIREWLTTKLPAEHDWEIVVYPPYA